jgi:hypothetical protein
MPGWFDFINGQTLPASRVQEFLMDQSVMKFADSGSRAAALPFPTDGMVSYLTDIDRLFVYRSSSSAWVQIAESTNLAALSAALPTRRNAIINGGFDIWQRGTSFTLNNVAFQYTADRFSVVRNLAGTDIVASQSNVVPTGFRHSLKIQRNAGSTTTNIPYLLHNLESRESVPLAGQSVTLSFWARAGANYSGSGSSLNVVLGSGTGTDQGTYVTLFTGYSLILERQPVLTTTWQRFTYTGTVSSAANQIGMYFAASWSGTAGADDSIHITGIQLEAGSVATPFVRAANTLQGELAACQRYFQVFTGNAVQENVGAGQCYSTTNALIHMSFMTTLRAAPTVSFSAATDFRIYTANGTEQTLSSIIGAVAPTINTCRIVVSVPSVLVTGDATAMIAANTNARINVSAEL